MRRRGAERVVALTYPRRNERVARDAGRASVAASLWHEVGDQAISVAAIYGADEFDGPP